MTWHEKSITPSNFTSFLVSQNPSSANHQLPNLSPKPRTYGKTNTLHKFLFQFIFVQSSLCFFFLSLRSSGSTTSAYDPVYLSGNVLQHILTFRYKHRHFTSILSFVLFHAQFAAFFWFSGVVNLHLSDDFP